MGSLTGQWFESAPGTFDARGGNFDGPWTGIGDDTISLTANEASTDQIYVNRTETLNVSADGPSVNSITLTPRSDTVAVALGEVSLVTASIFMRADALDVVLDDAMFWVHSDPQLSSYVVDALDVEFYHHATDKEQFTLGADTASLTLTETATVTVVVLSADDIDLAVDEGTSSIVVPISVVDSADVACDDTSVMQVILIVSDSLDLKIVRAVDVDRGEDGDTFYSDAPTGGSVGYVDV